MKQKTMQLVAILVVLILAVVSVTAYVLIYDNDAKDEKEEVVEEEFIVDDRVSPYTNQGLIVEMMRVRNRGLLDKMLSFGTSWRNEPSYYYTIEVDGVLGNSKGHLGEDPVYTTWDTTGKESSMPFYIEEEQKQSDITITILEVEQSGILGFRSTDVEKEKIKLTYDYRTGRWSGDDEFNDKDGYGYYLGDDYEVWFNLYQSDYDHDNIPYWTEVNVLRTDPTVDDSELDPDEDGIPTAWEWRWGYDPHTYNDHKTLDPDIDGIENIEEYQMRKWFSNPFQPDIYIETDGMVKKGFFDLDHEFYEEAQQMLIERFAQHGIKVFIDDGWPDGPVNGGGEMLPYAIHFDDVEGRQLLEYYNHHFPDERKGIFRYLLAGTIAGFTTPPTFNKFDTMEVGNSLKEALLVRLAFTPRAIRWAFGAVAMHELGHSLGLVPVTFPGNDIMPRYQGDRYPSLSDEDYNGYVTEYHSIMNYKYIYERGLFDYSDGSNHPKYDMDDWGSIYLPSFQVDQVMYEEPPDETFEDFEVSREYPGVIVEGWEFDENLTEMYSTMFESLALMKNTDDADIKVFVSSEPEDGEYNVRVYAKPDVEPVYAIYSLVAEGNLDSEDNVDFYSQQYLIKFTKSLIQ